MSEFELRRRLQGLRGDRHPQRDLWPNIAARLEAPAWRPVREARRVMLPWAAVAAVALTVGAGVWLASHLGSMLDARDAQRELATRAEPAPPLLHHEARAMQASFDGALAAAGGGRVPVGEVMGPELAAASRELDAAAAALNAALAEEPDAKYLVELLKRTQARRVALAKLGVRSA